MTKRQPISKALRFEVFKRDKFTCQYCGRSAPDVNLQIDHIHPVAKGGDNDILNLITSCADCNSGKRDRYSDSIKMVGATLDEKLEMLYETKLFQEMILDIIFARLSKMLPKEYTLILTEEIISIQQEFEEAASQINYLENQIQEEVLRKIGAK